jgi:general stress protein YciG
MGFQHMPKDRLRALSRSAAKKSAGRNRFTSKEAADAGRKGGKSAPREAKVEAGRKGGLARARAAKTRSKR